MTSNPRAGFARAAHNLPRQPVQLPSYEGPSEASTEVLGSGPKDLLVSHRTSWGILPQTPVFSLRSARCHWYHCSEVDLIIGWTGQGPASGPSLGMP
jgi:hypothetical protein